MDTSTRRLLTVLLLAIVVAGVGSGTFLIGLYMGRATATPLAGTSQSATLPGADAPQTPSPTNALATPESPGGDIRQKLSVLQEAYDLIRSEYYGDIPDDTQLSYGAIRGMIQSLGDNYTSFIEPRIANIIREDATGSFEGIGALVRINEGKKLEIIKVFQNTPAEAKGVQAGDQVVAVDGKSIIGFGIYEAIALIRGPANSDVRLTIERPGAEGKPFDVTVTRAKIEIPLVEARMIGSDIAYVSLSSFDATASDQLRQEIEKLLAQNPKGLILDLRGNPGGFLDQAIGVADLFLDKGLVMIERHRDGSEQKFTSNTGELAEKIPMAVLVDSGSASASEIVAGAIQDRGRGKLMGELTFGKGSVQRVHTLSDGSELRVTIARWFTPNNRAIHGQGLQPDIVVERGKDAAKDPQLDRALEYLRTGK
jgi:carboxyl-terminal processing protease